MKSRLFFIVFGLALGGVVLYGALALVSPGLLLESFEGDGYVLPESAGAVVVYLIGLFRLIGYFNLVLGMLGLVLLRLYAANGTRQLLYVVLATTVLAYAGPVVFDNTVGSVGPAEIAEHVLLAAVIVMGVVMMWRRSA
jgi:hypothetical protein